MPSTDSPIPSIHKGSHPLREIPCPILMAEYLSSKNQYECLFGIISQYKDSDNLKSLPYIPYGSILFSMHTPVILPHNYVRYETSEFQFFSFHPLFSYPRHNFIFHNTSFRMIQ